MSTHQVAWPHTVPDLLRDMLNDLERFHVLAAPQELWAVLNEWLLMLGARVDALPTLTDRAKRELSGLAQQRTVAGAAEIWGVLRDELIRQETQLSYIPPNCAPNYSGG